MLWMKLLAILLSVFLLWYLYRFAQNQSDLFTKANLGQTLYTLGWLALFLIAVIAVCVMLLQY
jgi:hypothetical protein